MSCNNCQTPGKSIKSLIKARKFADSEINGDTTVTPSSQATFIPLIQEEEYLRAHPDSTEQMHGYFEILNKSEVYICVKLFIGGDLFNEVPRPIFYPVGPNESLYAQFDKDVRQLNVIVLINNPHPIPMTRRVIVHKEGGRLPTSCCQVDKFEDFIVYKVPCSKKNVMLKYKDGKGLLVRDSKNLQRVTQSTMSKLMPASSMLTSLGLGGSKQQTTVQGSTVITSSPTNPGLNGNPRSPGRDTNIDKIELVFSSKQIDCSHDSVKLPGSGKAGSEGTATPRST